MTPTSGQGMGLPPGTPHSRRLGTELSTSPGPAASCPPPSPLLAGLSLTPHPQHGVLPLPDPGQSPAPGGLLPPRSTPLPSKDRDGDSPSTFIATMELPVPAQASAHCMGSKDRVTSALHWRVSGAPGSAWQLHGSGATSITHSACRGGRQQGPGSPGTAALEEGPGCLHRAPAPGRQRTPGARSWEPGPSRHRVPQGAAPTPTAPPGQSRYSPRRGAARAGGLSRGRVERCPRCRSGGREAGGGARRGAPRLCPPSSAAARLPAGTRARRGGRSRAAPTPAPATGQRASCRRDTVHRSRRRCLYSRAGRPPHPPPRPALRGRRSPRGRSRSSAAPQPSPGYRGAR